MVKNMVDCKVQLEFKLNRLSWLLLLLLLSRIHRSYNHPAMAKTHWDIAAIQYSILDDIFCSALHCKIMTKKREACTRNRYHAVYYLHPFSPLTIFISLFRSHGVLLPVFFFIHSSCHFDPLKGYLIGFWASSSLYSVTSHSIFSFSYPYFCCCFLLLLFLLSIFTIRLEIRSPMQTKPSAKHFR